MANMFALILVIATLVTGILWCVDKFFFAPKRRERQAAAQAGFDGQVAVLKHGKQLAARFQQEGQLVFGQLARFVGCVVFALDEG